MNVFVLARAILGLPAWLQPVQDLLESLQHALEQCSRALDGSSETLLGLLRSVRTKKGLPARVRSAASRWTAEESLMVHMLDTLARLSVKIAPQGSLGLGFVSGPDFSHPLNVLVRTQKTALDPFGLFDSDADHRWVTQASADPGGLHALVSGLEDPETGHKAKSDVFRNRVVEALSAKPRCDVEFIAYLVKRWVSTGSSEKARGLAHESALRELESLDLKRRNLLRARRTWLEPLQGMDLDEVCDHSEGSSRSFPKVLNEGVHGYLWPLDCALRRIVPDIDRDATKALWHSSLAFYWVQAPQRLTDMEKALEALIPEVRALSERLLREWTIDFLTFEET